MEKMYGVCYKAVEGYYEWYPVVSEEQKAEYEDEARLNGEEYVLWTYDINEAIQKTNELNAKLVRYAVIYNSSSGEVDYEPFFPWESFDKLGGRYWTVDQDNIFDCEEDAIKAVERLSTKTA